MGSTATDPQRDDEALADLSIRDFTARLATGDPVPGGGSAAAVAAAVAAGLVGMVAELTLGRAEYAAFEAAAREIQGAASSLRNQLLELAQEDAEAYEAVVRARRLPQESDEDRSLRRAALESATREATRVPLRTAQSAAQLLSLAGQVAPIGNRNAVSDAGVAADLAAAALRGALLNVRVNLPGLPEQDELRVEAERELNRLDAAAIEDEARVRAAVLARME